MKWNALSISSLILLTIGVILFVPTMGGSISIIGIGLVFLLTYYLLKDKERRVQVGTTIFLWGTIAIFMFYTSRRLVLTSDKRIEQNLYIICGVEGYPQLNKVYEWQKMVTVPADRVIVTSSSINRVPDVFLVKVGKQNKEQQVKGMTRQYSFCGNDTGLIILTIGKEESGPEIVKKIEAVKEKYCKTPSANTAQALVSAMPRP
jgi:hypothetical protein